MIIREKKRDGLLTRILRKEAADKDHISRSLGLTGRVRDRGGGKTMRGKAHLLFNRNDDENLESEGKKEKRGKPTYLPMNRKGR